MLVAGGVLAQKGLLPMTEKEVSRMTKLQREKVRAQMDKVQRLQSYLLDLSDGQPLNPSFSNSDELLDEFTHSQSFLFGMLFMVKDDPELN